MVDVAIRDIPSTVNGLFFGFVVSNVLLGITLIQGWIYMNNYSHDRLYLRLFVVLLVILDIADTCCSTEILHYYLISNPGSIAIPGISATIIVNVEFFLTGVVFFLVHLFFAIQLWKFSKNWWLPTVIMVLNTAMLVAGGFSPSLTLSEGRLSLIKVETTVFHGLAVATDVLVTLGLSWYLYDSKSEMKNTRMTIHRLIAYIMSRGILITTVQIAHIIMYATDAGDWFFWMSTHIVLSKLYVGTMLFILNSRRSLRARINHTVELESIHYSARTPETTDIGFRRPDNSPTLKPPQLYTENNGEDREVTFVSVDHSTDTAHILPSYIPDLALGH